jgi:hypothetical protein
MRDHSIMLRKQLLYLSAKGVGPIVCKLERFPASKGGKRLPVGRQFGKINLVDGCKYAIIWFKFHLLLRAAK